jgi:hypothetical protein
MHQPQSADHTLNCHCGSASTMHRLQGGTQTCVAQLSEHIHAVLSITCKLNGSFTTTLTNKQRSLLLRRDSSRQSPLRAPSAVVLGDLADAAVREPEYVRVEPISAALQRHEPLLNVLLLTAGGVTARNGTQPATLTGPVTASAHNQQFGFPCYFAGHKMRTFSQPDICPHNTQQLNSYLSGHAACPLQLGLPYFFGVQPRTYFWKYLKVLTVYWNIKLYLFSCIFH